MFKNYQSRSEGGRLCSGGSLPERDITMRGASQKAGSSEGTGGGEEKRDPGSLDSMVNGEKVATAETVSRAFNPSEFEKRTRSDWSSAPERRPGCYATRCIRDERAAPAEENKQDTLLLLKPLEQKPGVIKCSPLPKAALKGRTRCGKVF